MKLKTLKDLRERKIGFVCERELKAEAIKWVKKWNVWDKKPTGEEDLGFALMAGSTGAFMKFFNITKEDLNLTELEGGKRK